MDGGTRGDFIGWSAAERQAGLLLIVNNARFLLLVLRSARPSHPSAKDSRTVPALPPPPSHTGLTEYVRSPCSADSAYVYPHASAIVGKPLRPPCQTAHFEPRAV